MGTFKIERKSVSMDIELSTGVCVNAKVLLPNTKQIQGLLKAGEAGASASLDYQISLLESNIECSQKKDLIEDIMEMGDVTSFFNQVQTLAATQKKP